MRRLLIFFLFFFTFSSGGEEQARVVTPDYQSPKAVYDFFLDEPGKLDAALYWIRALMTPLSESPYDMTPEEMDIKVVIHGTEIVTLVKKNYQKYRDQVERMRYYQALGVEFKVCALAARDYGYDDGDFQPFVEIVPSAFTELVHWQQQGYALITPQVFYRTKTIDEIR
jgi:intracellular sulfur oxidation DsrE/DsrF family protein